MLGSVGPTPNPSGGGEVWSVWEVRTLHNKNAFHVAQRFGCRRLELRSFASAKRPYNIRIININWAIISKKVIYLVLIT